MKKYFVVIEVWRDPKLPDIYGCGWSYVNGWNPLTEEYLISDFGENAYCSDLRSAVQDNDWNTEIPPFLFDTIEEAKNAIEIIKVHNHSLIYNSSYHIVLSETVTVTYPYRILEINEVKLQ